MPLIGKAALHSEPQRENPSSNNNLRSNLSLQTRSLPFPTLQSMNSPIAHLQTQSLPTQDNVMPHLTAMMISNLISQARSLLVQEDATPHPTIVHRTPLTTLWHRLNTSFDLPKAAVIILVTSPESYSTPEAAVLEKLLAQIIHDQLNETAYDAELAGEVCLFLCASSGHTCSF